MSTDISLLAIAEGKESRDVVFSDCEEGEQQQAPSEVADKIGKTTEVEQAGHQLQGNCAQDHADHAAIATFRLNTGHDGNQNGDQKVRTAIIELHVDVACRDDDARNPGQQTAGCIGGDQYAVARKTGKTAAFGLVPISISQ